MTWIIMLGIFVIDQISKYYVVQNLHYLESTPVIPNIFHLTYVHNYGAAFGILQNKRVFFIVISVLVITVFLYFYRHLPKDWMTKIAVGMALGGTIGNLFDRLRLGYVVDFFDFQIWPVFNIADSALVVGMILLAWRVLFTDEDAVEANESLELDLENDQEMTGDDISESDI